MTDLESAFAADDFPITQVPSDPLWTENYALSLNDSANRIGLIAFLGRWCGDAALWREAVSIALPGNRIVCIKNFGRAASSTVASAALLELEVVKPGECIRLIYDGLAYEQQRDALFAGGMSPTVAKRCRFDLLWTGVAPIWSMSGHGHDSAEISGKLHIEQIGRGDGYIEFDGARWNVQAAFTNRDHSRGIRRLDRFHRSCWAQGYFPKTDLTFSVYAIGMFGVEGLAMANASITQAGKRYPATISAVDMPADASEMMHRYRMVLSSELGTLELTNIETLTSASLSAVSPWDLHHGALPGVPSIRVVEEAVRWESAGNTGLGWSERCFTPNAVHHCR
ncbi:MAG: hypothetical protein ABW110_20575 [Steroidobacteraceae bacterium]